MIMMIMIIYIDLESEEEEDPLMHYLNGDLHASSIFSKSPILINRPLYFIQVPRRLIMPNFKTWRFGVLCHNLRHELSLNLFAIHI